jgi:hypothetical protein
MASTTTINNVAYSWSMIQLQTNLSGENSQSPIFVDCTSIKWSTERKVESIYGLGGQPRKRGFGNVTYEASITLPYSTQIELRSKSSDGTLIGLGEFNLIVSWVNDLGSNTSTETVTLAGCILTQSGMEASQDDTSITKEFDLHPHRIYTNKIASQSSQSWSREMYSK